MNFFVPCNWHFRHKGLARIPHSLQQVVVVVVAWFPSLWNTFQSNFDDFGWVNENGYSILSFKKPRKRQSFYQRLNIFSFIENWLTCLTTFTIPRHCLRIGFPSFVRGFHPTKLVSRKERPKFCAISRKTKFCTSLLVFHNRAAIFSLSTNVDVVARVSNLILYNTLWGKNVNATQSSKREVEQILDQSFSLIWVSNI